MYKFHYKCIGRTFNTNLLLTDANILVNEIETEDVYKDFYRNKNLFDFSDYPQNSKFFDPVDKKVIGKMKDEVKGKIISEPIGLKSNIYSLIVMDCEEIKKVKRVKKNVVKNIRQKEYVDALFDKYIFRHKMKRIQSKLHRIGTYDVCKISLSSY